MTAPRTYQEIITSLKTENERLKLCASEHYANTLPLEILNKELRAENERLLKALETRTNYKQEIKELREALEKIAEYKTPIEFSTTAHYARAALSQSGEDK
jgi:hypothetical protein